MARVITYECDECGCEILVRETPETDLAPIYCCGEEVAVVPSVKKTAGARKKTAGKGTAKKTRAKKTTAKKTTAKKTAGKTARKVVARPAKKTTKKKAATKRKAAGKAK